MFAPGGVLALQEHHPPLISYQTDLLGPIVFLSTLNLAVLSGNDAHSCLAVPQCRRFPGEAITRCDCVPAIRARGHHGHDGIHTEVEKVNGQLLLQRSRNGGLAGAPRGVEID